MKRCFAAILLLCWSLLVSAQDKSAAMDSLLDRYFDALKYESVETKSAETDFIIGSVSDSLLRQRAAIKIYDHYAGSNVMGEEAVAVHVYDTWFATHKVEMLYPEDLVNAGVFVDFNRNSLVGMPAPQATLQDPSGNLETIPQTGGLSVLFFYNTSCAKCKMEAITLKYYLKEKLQSPIDFYAVYVGDDREEWDSFRSERLQFDSDSVRMHHLWDPERETDIQKLYGVLQTPRMFLIGPDGEILGRRLDTESLGQLMGYASALLEMYNRYPAGSLMTDLTVPCTIKTSGKSGKGKPKVSEGLHSLREADYILFYTRGCANCKDNIAAVDSLLERKPLQRRKVALLVDLDKLSSDNEPLARTLLDTFDLSVLPLAFTLDSHGYVLERSNSFTDN